ncbi:hypothetical protein IPG41_05430 [Candidatus Peregrinibacteria bacterium]|nr:MAG: hypothetical protein IPG41_05430 [Candidatus Peregrinibacteria bacterium]
MTDLASDKPSDGENLDIASRWKRETQGKTYHVDELVSLVKGFLADAQPEDREALQESILEWLCEEFHFYIDLLRSTAKKFDLDRLYWQRLSLEEMDALSAAIQAELQTEFEARGKQGVDLQAQSAMYFYKISRTLGSFTEAIAALQESRKQNIADGLAQLLHDFNGVNTYPLLYLHEASSNRAFAEDHPENLDMKVEAEMSYGYAHFAGHAFQHLIACHQLLLRRLMAKHQLLLEEMDISAFMEVTANAQAFRFNNMEAPLTHISIEVEKEEGVNSILKASPDALHLIFLNVFKNAAKIIQERKIAKEKQTIHLRFFEREGVLFLHYNDHIGGLDLTALFHSAVEKTIHWTHNRAGEQLPAPLRVIQGGAFNAADMFTMRDLCELIFLERVRARRGGSGLGMKETYELLAENGMMLSTALNREEGTQFLFAFPKSPTELGVLKDLMRRVEAELDQKETVKLGLAA